MVWVQGQVHEWQQKVLENNNGQQTYLVNHVGGRFTGKYLFMMNHGSFRELDDLEHKQ